MLNGAMLAAGLLLAQVQPDSNWLQSTWSVILLIIGFSLVIFVHELGHFLAAKWAKVRVEKFCIGFGRELFGFTHGGTRYAFNILPLGGYVKMLGQEDFVVDKSGELKVKDNPDSFTNKSIGQRMVIVSGGVIMNLLFAAVAFAVVVMVGRYQPPAVIGDVRPNSPAARAGLQAGDQILEINGTSIRSFQDLMSRVMLSDPEEVLEFAVQRDGRKVDPPPKVLPEFNQDEEVRQVGFYTGANRRIASSSLRPIEEPGETELRKYDELYALIENGQPTPRTRLGDFVRALQAARGRPVEFVVKRPQDVARYTDEMAFTDTAAADAVEATVRVQALWAPAAHVPKDPGTISLLGLVPRLSVFGVPGKAFAQSEVQQGDVITRLGAYAYPNIAEVRKEIQDNPDRELALEVRRSRTANQGLAAQTVVFCVSNREALISAALVDVGQALAKTEELARAASLPGEERDKLLARLREAGDGPGMRRWLEGVDVHVLKPLVPKRAWALFNRPPPKLDTELYPLDEDHLVVADVLDKLGERVSPAKAAGIPRGAVILSVNGQPVRQWYELSELFRVNAGQTVELTYRVADAANQRTSMAIPNCVSVALAIPVGARILEIDGQSSRTIATADGQSKEYSLPDSRAVEALLNGSIGRTVQVDYVTAEGEKRSGMFTATADNTDPWALRIVFISPFGCYPLLERNPVRNPVLAVGIGFRQAYDATMQTIQSIRHMIFTRQVGLSKVSGPVGIVRMGSRLADAGIIDLLWFLAVISANLAVINFLPMPIVDGGLFLFLILEKIRGEPVSIKTQVATQLIGIALIATLFILITYQDIKNWILGA